MKYDRTVIAYHGCDAETAERLLHGEQFKKSQNDYDWLGEGIYFWEYGADRAFKFAQDQQRRGKVAKPAVVGALIQLGRCFDLMDTHLQRSCRLLSRCASTRSIEQGNPCPRTPVRHPTSSSGGVIVQCSTIT